MINPLTGWFVIAQYNYKRETSVKKPVETTWLSRYLRPKEIPYDQGS